MRGYRKTQSDKDARREALIDDTEEQLRLFEEFVRAQMDAGFTSEQARQQYLDATTPPEEERPISQVADAAPAPHVSANELLERNRQLLERWRQMGHGQHQANAELPKAASWQEERARKRAEEARRQHAVDVVKATLASMEKSELQDIMRIGAFMQEAKERSEQEISDVAQKYLERGVPEAAANESAMWEIKQKKLKSKREWDALTDEEKVAKERKLLKDSKRSRGDSRE